ncbi:MAG: YihY/virulence factor BrkB family protein, partial [Cytophagaceae bacterium]
NIAYNEKIERGFIKNNILGLIVTLGLMVVGFISALVVIAFPAFIEQLGLPGAVETAISLLRWPVLFAIIIFSIGVIYKFAPDRDNPQFKWVSYGAAVAAFLWILGSLLFSLYVNNFGDFDATYGSVAAVIILMLWFQLTGISVLLGAEINSELEHQTAKDTTIGKPEPIGSRDAFAADHVAGRQQQPKAAADDDTDKKSAERLKDRDRAKRNRNRRAKGRKPDIHKNKGENQNPED